MALRIVLRGVRSVVDQLKPMAVFFNPINSFLNKNKNCLVNNSFFSIHHHHYFSPAPPRQKIVDRARNKYSDDDIVEPIDNPADDEKIKHLVRYAVQAQNHYQRLSKGLQPTKIVRASRMMMNAESLMEISHWMYYITLEAVDKAGKLDTYYTEIVESRLKDRVIDEKAQQEKKKYEKVQQVKKKYKKVKKEKKKLEKAQNYRKKTNEEWKKIHDRPLEKTVISEHSELMLWRLVDDKSFYYPFVETRFVRQKSKSGYFDEEAEAN